jgi:hypothetical protein
LILDFEFDKHLESHKYVISIIVGFREGCYNRFNFFFKTAARVSTLSNMKSDQTKTLFFARILHILNIPNSPVKKV